jgi:4-hydroxy-L-threonine phosphate dehydrogenase PdxA
VRTSVDHGVAFDLVGKGTVDLMSLEFVLDLAIRITS